jgi:putative transposase
MVNVRRDNSIAKAMQLVAGRTGQEYNQRKSRLGAYWEDRYHATLVESGVHLLNCMAYIDTNMVRAQVVRHPKEWPFCGYQEISGRRERYRLIHQVMLASCVGMDFHTFGQKYEGLIAAYLKQERYEREGKWTESLAVGSRDFISQIKLELGTRARGWLISEKGDAHTLREHESPYGSKKGLEIESKALFLPGITRM